MAPVIQQLLFDPEVDPAEIGGAGWLLQRRSDSRLEGAVNNADLKALAQQLEHNKFALALLQECPVGDREVEMTLTRVRRWLGTSGEWKIHPDLLAALAAQTALNGGAWMFDETERAVLDDTTAAPLAAAYLPVRPDGETGGRNRSEFAHRITRAVAEQYELRPFPIWRRITFPVPVRLAEIIRPYNSAISDALPAQPRILVAGCGTGQQAARIAVRYQGAIVTAIDISEASLSFARRQCAILGVPEIRFCRLDLNEAARLGETYDAVFCAGVLHHLPDPEAGWGALADVLKPGGVMRIAVYSRLGRLRVAAARALLGKLAGRPVDDDLLRQARSLLLRRRDLKAICTVVDSCDFSTLAGTCDLLFHRHEDPFDVLRIECAMRKLGLGLLGFDLRAAQSRAEYAKLFPGDPQCSDFGCWRRFEQKNPSLFLEMYSFWCAKPLARMP